jgi:hypothetical protein
LPLVACGETDDGDDSETVGASPSITSSPRDAAAAEAALADFVDAVQNGRLDEAWMLYAASVPGDLSTHRGDLGCRYEIFSFEFPRIQHLFQRISPLSVTQSYGSSLGESVVELMVLGADGGEFLATLARGEPDGKYKMMLLNNGRPALVPGAPDPAPSPEDPMGFCGIWTGSR